MGKRILLAGIVGGVVMFSWGSVAHILLPLGDAGIREIPNEEPVLAAMRASITEPGFYFFPGMGEKPGMTEEQREAAYAAWTEKYKTSPAGILVYQPQGGEALSPRQLATELATNTAVALVLAFLLSLAAGSLPGYGMRVVFVAACGLIPWLDVDVSQWNWYRFPTEYTLAQLVTEVVGYALVGLVLARFIKKQ
jgi:hypothetical protein